MLRILIAVDHANIRKGLKQILLAEYPSAFVTEVSEAEGVISKLLQAAWDFLICDLSMPGCSGLDVLHDVNKFSTTSCPDSFYLPPRPVCYPRSAGRCCRLPDKGAGH